MMSLSSVQMHSISNQHVSRSVIESKNIWVCFGGYPVLVGFEGNQNETTHFCFGGALKKDTPARLQVCVLFLHELDRLIEARKANSQ